MIEENDNDDKLVIVPENKEYSEDAIKALTEFQERYFESIIKCYMMSLRN